MFLYKTNEIIQVINLENHLNEFLDKIIISIGFNMRINF